MIKTAILLAPGFEEVEALTVVDLLRRAELGCDMLALEPERPVTGSHGICVLADALLDEADLDAYDALILPGGKPGTQRLAGDGRVAALLRRFAAQGKRTAAICAAPTVLAQAGLLEGKRATCYPGMEDQLTGAQVRTEPVVADGTVVTSRGLGTAIPFALALVRLYRGEDRAQALAKAIVYEP